MASSSREGGQCPSPTCSHLLVIKLEQLNARGVEASHSHHFDPTTSLCVPPTQALMPAPLVLAPGCPVEAMPVPEVTLTGEAPGSPENLQRIRLVCSNRANSSLAFLVSV